MVYLTDKIKIISCSKDKYSVITETENNEVDARVKDDNRLVMNNQGQEVAGNMNIKIKSTNIVKYGDKIKVTKRWGNDYELKDKKFAIHKIEGMGGFSKDLIRVII